MNKMQVDSKKVNWIFLSYYLGMLSIHILISGIAQTRFPTDYSFLIHKISAQGSITANPEGYLIWNIGMIGFGLCLIPIFFFLVNQFHKWIYEDHHMFLLVLKLLFLISSVALTFVGIFPREYPIAHAIPAAIALYGFWLTCSLYSIFLLRLTYIQKIQMKKGFLAITFIIIGIFPMTFAYLGNFYRMFFLTPAWNKWWTTYPPWQWSMYASIFWWIFMTFVLFFYAKWELQK